MKILPMPSRQRLDVLLTFNPDTGEINWKVSRGGNKAGDIAGCIWTCPETGMKYRQIRIDGILYWAHRLAYYYYNYEQPIQVDHKNGNGLDNRKDNLRSANDELNGKNRGIPKNNTSGVIGVHYDKRKKFWVAQYGSVEFRKKHGTYKFIKTFEEAVAQRKMWEDQFGMTEAKKHRGTSH